MDSRVFKT